jgi:hypothetical protein
VKAQPFRLHCCHAELFERDYLQPQPSPACADCGSTIEQMLAEHGPGCVGLSWTAADRVLQLTGAALGKRSGQALVGALRDVALASQRDLQVEAWQRASIDQRRNPSSYRRRAARVAAALEQALKLAEPLEGKVAIRGITGERGDAFEWDAWCEHLGEMADAFLGYSRGGGRAKLARHRPAATALMNLRSRILQVLSEHGIALEGKGSTRVAELYRVIYEDVTARKFSIKTAERDMRERAKAIAGRQ